MPNANDPLISINLSASQWKYVLAVLRKRPMEECEGVVYALMAQIKMTEEVKAHKEPDTNIDSAHKVDS